MVFDPHVPYVLLKLTFPLGELAGVVSVNLNGAIFNLFLLVPPKGWRDGEWDAGRGDHGPPCWELEELDREREGDGVLGEKVKSWEEGWVDCLRFFEGVLSLELLLLVLLSLFSLFAKRGSGERAC